MLNIASGPARDLREWFDANPESEIRFDCIELDPTAIAHATAVCAAYGDRITFHHQNALKFVPAEKYDLIWSAGLFDYLTDRLFTRVVRSLIPFVKAGGEVVVVAEEVPGGSVLSVSDTGVGISPEELTRLSRVFEQGEAGKKQKGAGLGLSVVRAFAELHRGTLTIVPRESGGTRISVFFPDAVGPGSAQNL